MSLPFASKAANEEALRTLTAERAKASFDVRTMTYVLDGGKSVTERKERLDEIARSEPTFDKTDKYFSYRRESYKRVLQKATLAVRKIIEHGLSIDQSQRFMLSLGDEVMFALHHAMFIPTIESQGTKIQRAKFLGPARAFLIIGCYAQTEMGHGSNVQGIETTATFDKLTDEFVLNTPSITALKWWPGGLGKTATHAVTHARLIIGGRDHGIHTFVVQIRSTEDHMPLDGIVVGDIGPKFGYDTQDNGFLGFKSVRIPRENMLMKYKKVDRDGNYSQAPPQFSKLGYLTMIRIRAGIVSDAYETLAKACTIAIRYSAVRRQFGDGSGDGELQVLDYQMQQHRLFPLLAAAYAFLFTGRYMSNLFEAAKKGLRHEDASALPEVHATSAGLKALTTWITSNGIEECRKCCGGHGYHKFAGLSDLYVNYIPACTYEGDNVVLSLQTARFLVKCVKRHQKGKPLFGTVVYVQDDSLKHVVEAHSVEEFLCSETFLQAYMARARALCFSAADAVAHHRSIGMTKKQAINACQILLVSASKAHCMFTVVKHFCSAVEGVEAPREAKSVLRKLCALFALYNIQKEMGQFLEIGCIASEQAPLIHAAVEQLLVDIRPDAIALVDAFNFSDWLLNSSLGRYNGDVYEHMFQWAQKAPLNQSHIPPGYEEYLKPLLSGDTVVKAMNARQRREEAKEKSRL